MPGNPSKTDDFQSCPEGFDTFRSLADPLPPGSRMPSTSRITTKPATASPAANHSTLRRVALNAHNQMPLEGKKC